MTWGKGSSKFGPCQDKRDGTEIGIHGGTGGAVCGDDDFISRSDGETGGDDGVGSQSNEGRIQWRFLFIRIALIRDCEVVDYIITMMN